jgi:hypothetical protein
VILTTTLAPAPVNHACVLDGPLPRRDRCRALPAYLAPTRCPARCLVAIDAPHLRPRLLLDPRAYNKDLSDLAGRRGERRHIVAESRLEGVNRRNLKFTTLNTHYKSGLAL